MEHDLLAYLLQGLDPDEERAVEAHLEADPAARTEMQNWRRLLDPLGQLPPVEPPAGLYMNTLRAVAGQMVQARGPVFPARDESGDGGGTWWRRVDLLVAAAVLLVLGLLLPPVLLYLRHRQGVMTCQQNMARLHQAYHQYWDTTGGALPNLADLPENLRVAGMHPVMLREKQCWPEGINLNCPAAAKDVLQPLTDLHEADKLAHTGDLHWARRLGGQYAYPLGYFELNHLRGLRKDMGDDTPILADRSPFDASLTNSPNHGGKGQNVLFMGGHVRWITVRTVGEDDIFLNADGKLAAGLHSKDIVLGPSEARPVPLPTTTRVD